MCYADVSVVSLDVDGDQNLILSLAHNYSEAPASTNICSISVWSRHCATYRSDSPFALLAFTSAPALVSTRTASVLPRQIAVYNSGSLSASLAFTSAPASTSS